MSNKPTRKSRKNSRKGERIYPVGLVFRGNVDRETLSQIASVLGIPLQEVHSNTQYSNETTFMGVKVSKQNVLDISELNVAIIAIKTGNAQKRANDPWWVERMTRSELKELRFQFSCTGR